jgi:hypothetical protein
MSNTPLDHAELLSLYEQQTTFISDVIYQHPDSLKIFDDEEREIFVKYFSPDWVNEIDFVRYYEKLEQEDPTFIVRANELLQKFLQQNDLDAPELLLPQ